MFYSPEEDTFLLRDVLIEYLSKTKNSNLNILEMGIGSGYILKYLVEKFPNNNLFGVDINKAAIENSKRLFSKFKNVNIFYSDLFSNIKNEKFDLIFFNTPYLPLDFEDNLEKISMKDRAIYGGKNGYEVTLRFLKQLYNYLKKEGTCFILISNLTKPKVIEEFLEKNLYEFKVVSKKEVGMFEELLVFKIEKSLFLKKLEELNVKNVEYLSSGKHSIVLQGDYNNKHVIIKIGLDKHIFKEYFILKKLEKEEFITKPIYYEKYGKLKNFDFKSKVFFDNLNEEISFLIKEKAEGELIGEFLEKESSKEKIIHIINKILEICQRLDRLGINKYEMTNPYKHIFIDNNLKVKMIDFERFTYTEHPKNTTQFLQYLIRKSKILKEKGINLNKERIIEISKKYKSENFKFQINLENLI